MPLMMLQEVGELVLFYALMVHQLMKLEVLHQEVEHEYLVVPIHIIWEIVFLLIFYILQQLQVLSLME